MSERAGKRYGGAAGLQRTPTDSTQLTLKSSSQKYEPIYKLKVRYEAPSGQKWEDKEVEGTFMEWFNVHGYLQKKELQQWLAKNIQVVGLAENEAHRKTTDTTGDELRGKTVTVASSTGVESSSTAGKKSRKKKKP